MGYPSDPQPNDRSLWQTGLSRLLLSAMIGIAAALIWKAL
jgi:hypothetical protein